MLKKRESKKTRLRAAVSLGALVENLVKDKRTNTGDFIDGLQALYHLEKLLPFEVQPNLSSASAQDVWKLVKHNRRKEAY